MYILSAANRVWLTLWNEYVLPLSLTHAFFLSLSPLSLFVFRLPTSLSMYVLFRCSFSLSRILSTDQDSAQKQPSTASSSSLPYASGNSAASQHGHATATPPHYCDVPPDSVQRRGVSATSPRYRDVPPDSIQRGDVSATSPHYRDLPPDSVQRRDVLLDGTRRVNYINGDWKETSVNVSGSSFLTPRFYLKIQDELN